LPIRIPPIAPQSSSSSIIWGWYNYPNSGRSTKWTQSHPMRKNNNVCRFSFDKYLSKRETFQTKIVQIKEYIFYRNSVCI
jgi:hypothetical protein